MSEREEFVPVNYSRWQHTNGNEYLVLLVTNLTSTREEYPITVVYQGLVNGLVWSRPLSEWYRSMKELTV